MGETAAALRPRPSARPLTLEASRGVKPCGGPPRRSCQEGFACLPSPLTLLPGLTLFSDAEEGMQLEQHEVAAAHAALGAGAAAP